MNCRFLDTQKSDPFTNMAVDEALLDSDMPVLRLYQWSPAAVSIGYNQNAEREINLEFCEENNVPIVRRITGGKAVYHDKELTYSIIIPEKLNLVPKDVTESYKVIANALITALKEIEIFAEIKKQPDKVATPICFNSANWYELMVDGKKISGSAQRRVHGMILQHGSILINFDSKINAKIFKTESKEKTLQELETNITCVNDETKNFDLEKLKSSLKNSFEKQFNFEMHEENLTDTELEKVKKLMKEKYETNKWNLNCNK